ncbi:MAG: hypothetical protein HC875_33400 [Anaerolineales bacterium]|nr:hypothetical protein [Anaerolineales bacterium]
MAFPLYTAPRNGLNNASAFQVSGIPYITGAVGALSGVELRFQFPFVSRSITVINRAATDIRIYFNSSTSGRVITGSHYITLSEARDSITMNVKAKEIYVMPIAGAGDFEIYAELTTIRADEMFTLTGSGLTQ